jgi:xylulokinase
MWVGRFPICRYQFGLAYAKTAGVVLEWFNREFCPDKSLSELDRLAESSPIGSNGVTVLPHFDGMVSPKPNPDAKGLICNLTLGSNLADIYRGILESLTFSLRENVELLQSVGFDAGVLRSIGGGAGSDFWLQMKADVTGLPVERPVVTEAATLGAAMLAAFGAGEFASLEESSVRLYKAQRVFAPETGNNRLYAAPYHVYRELCQKAYG